MQTVFALLNLSRALSSATFTRPLDCVSQAVDIVDQFGALESLAALAYVESGDALELFRCDDATSAMHAATSITKVLRGADPRPRVRALDPDDYDGSPTFYGED